MENRRRKGNRYEQMAAEYLTGLGYTIITHNYNCRIGEVDLVAWEGRYLVFVEVKYRADSRMGMPQESVSVSKQRTIVRVAEYYMMCNNISDITPVRFDVVAILGTECTVIKNAFEYRR